MKIGELKSLVEGKILQTVDISDDSDEGIILTIGIHKLEIGYSSMYGEMLLDDKQLNLEKDIK